MECRQIENNGGDEVIMLVAMAWRNLWRNKRRTFITVASVVVAVSLATGMRALQKGTYADIINNAVRYSTGYIQVHAKGYWDSPSLDNSFLAEDTLQHAIREDHNITLAVPRLESFALISNGPRTKPVEVIGTEPGTENTMTRIANRVVRGKYIGGQDSGLLLGDGLAEYLRLRVGDTVILLGQGYHGSTSAGKYPVEGIFHFPVENLNNSLVYLPLPAAQSLFHTPDRLTTMSLMLHDPEMIDADTRNLQSALGSNWEVMQWSAMNKDFVQGIESDNVSGQIMLAILYLVIAFGVFGTVLMMTMERRREFAVMIAMGMKKAYLESVLWVETIFIGALGVLGGFAIALPLLLYYHYHPIRFTGALADAYQQFGFEPVMKVSLQPSIFINQGLVVFVIAIVVAIYPMWYAGRFRIVESLK